MLGRSHRDRDPSNTSQSVKIKRVFGLIFVFSHNHKDVVASLHGGEISKCNDNKNEEKEQTLHHEKRKNE